MSADFDPYRELGLSPEAAGEPELVRAAFKALARKYHPDAYSEADGKAKAEEKMRRLNEAQRLILSGEYTPPPPATLVHVEHSREREFQQAPPVQAPPRREPKKTVRTVSMGPMVVAGLLLLVGLVGPGLFARDHLAEAIKLEEQGQWKQALEQANQAVIDDPRNGQAYLLRARLWQQLDQPERARTDLDNARGLIPKAEFEKADKKLFPAPTASPAAIPTPAPKGKGAG